MGSGTLVGGTGVGGTLAGATAVAGTDVGGAAVAGIAVGGTVTVGMAVDGIAVGGATVGTGGDGLPRKFDAIPTAMSAPNTSVPAITRNVFVDPKSIDRNHDDRPAGPLCPSAGEGAVVGWAHTPQNLAFSRNDAPHRVQFIDRTPSWLAPTHSGTSEQHGSIAATLHVQVRGDDAFFLTRG